jgi:hypothetical protein
MLPSAVSNRRNELFLDRFEYEVELARSWDSVFAGQIPELSPLPAVHLVDTLDRLIPADQRGRGLYIGAGNGRNYTPLVNRGFDLTAIDLSMEAVRQLDLTHPERRHRHFCGDFLQMNAWRWPLVVVVVVRALHEGGRTIALRNLVEAAGMVEEEGMFAIQIPATGTTLWPGYEIEERFDTGGFSIRQAGAATLRFYFSREDVAQLMESAILTPIVGPWLVESPKRGMECGIVRNWLLVATRKGR